MAMQDLENSITISKNTVREKGGVVVFDLPRYQIIENELWRYRAKEQLLRSLTNFDKLAEWGRNFAKRKSITKEQILEDD